MGFKLFLMATRISAFIVLIFCCTMRIFSTRLIVLPGYAGVPLYGLITLGFRRKFQDILADYRRLSALGTARYITEL